jgi:hypothetical protein
MPIKSEEKRVQESKTAIWVPKGIITDTALIQLYCLEHGIQVRASSYPSEIPLR